MRNSLVWIILFCLLFPVLVAEEKEEKPDVEETVEVIGKVPLVRALQSVSVLDRERVQGSGRDGLKELLNQCPGMLVLNAGNPAQFSYAFARGASVNQMLYLIDGVKLHDPSSSLSGNFSFLSPQLVEKVEIVRGPLSSMYGSSAMGGVINVITRRKEGMRFSLAGGSHGTWDSQVHFGKRLGAFHVFLNAGMLNFDDRLANDRVERKSFAIHSGYDRDDLTLGLSFFGSLVDAGIPRNLGMTTLRRGYGQDNVIVSLPLGLGFGDRGRLDVTASLHWNRYDFRDPDDAWNPQFANESFIAEAQAKFTTRLLKYLKLVAGADLSTQRIANLENDQTLIPGTSMGVASIYADLQADLDRLLLAGSLRYDKYEGRAGVLSPHFGASLNLTPFLKLRTSASRSFRAPTLPEMLNPYWGNAALLPETGSSIEAGVDLYAAALQFGLTVFDSTYRNLIGYSPLTSRFANINRADVRGAEVSLDWQVLAGVHCRAAYTHLHAQDIQYGRELLRRPRHVFSAALSYRTASGLSASADVTVVGKRLDYDELLWTVAENKAFNQVGLMLRLPLWKHVSVFCRMDNALNARYEEVLGYPAPLRRLLLGAAYQVGD